MAIMKQSLKEDEISVVGGIEAKQNFTCQNKQFKALELLKLLTNQSKPAMREKND